LLKNYDLLKLNKNAKEMKIKICKAERKDINDILRLINELAKFEKLDPPDEKAKKRLKKDAFGKNPKFKVILAKTKNGTAGYAFYFFTYSSFRAQQTLYLEDIFISENFRRFGIGKMLMDELVKIAKKNKCGRMEWVVLDWNTNAINFYEKLGAKHLNDWLTYRINF
jgi:ribosomal protein S18 acetylase RimI-like enzyme